MATDEPLMAALTCNYARHSWKDSSCPAWPGINSSITTKPPASAASAAEKRRAAQKAAGIQSVRAAFLLPRFPRPAKSTILTTASKDKAACFIRRSTTTKRSRKTTITRTITMTKLPAARYSTQCCKTASILILSPDCRLPPPLPPPFLRGCGVRAASAAAASLAEAEEIATLRHFCCWTRSSSSNSSLSRIRDRRRHRDARAIPAPR